MALTVTSQTLHDGQRNVVMQFTGRSDGAGQETNVVKVDASELNPPAGKNLRVRCVTYDVRAGLVELLWGADTPMPFLNLTGQNIINYDRIAGLVNGGGESANGDILLSTKGFELDSSYSITLEMVKG